MKQVATTVINSNGKVLLKRRKTVQKLTGYWKFSSGKVEDGETFKECPELEIK